MIKTDVAIVGGGPGGSSSALFLGRQGIRSVVIEQEVFPRFHIGESMTGECGGLVRQLGFEDRMVGSGHAVKHGVTVYGKGGRNEFWVPVMRRTRKGLEAFSTWQVRRSQFDTMMLERALEEPAELVLGQAVHPILDEEGKVVGVRVRSAGGREEDILSNVVIDASGRKTWLANAGITGPKLRDKYDKQVAVFSHLSGVGRDAGPARGNTIIFYKDFLKWAWFIPLDDDIVSIGVVTPNWYFKDCHESPNDFFRREIRELNPQLAWRVEDSELVEEVRTATNYSYLVDRFAGPGFVCVGDSHRFIDPIFSFGLYLTISDAQMAAEAVAAHLGSDSSSGDPFKHYENRSKTGLAVLQDLIDGFWSNPLAFGYLAHFTEHREGVIDIFAGRIYDGESELTRGVLQRIVARAGVFSNADN